LKFKKLFRSIRQRNDIENICADLAWMGLLERGVDEFGEKTYLPTELGKAAAKWLIENDPAMAEFVKRVRLGEFDVGDAR
jgi:hypothetical protein